jgi:hypothetical protein
MGSLYPSSSHPFFAEKSAEQIRRIARQLRLEVNGAPVLIGHHRSAEVAAGSVAFGEDAAVEETQRFRGAIFSTHRLGRASLAAPGAAGPFVRLRLAFKADADGTCEPLVAFGESKLHPLLTVTQVAARQVKFGFLEPVTEAVESPSIDIGPGRSHELKVRFEDTGQLQRRRILVSCDAELIWSEEVLWLGREPGGVAVGKNRNDIPGCAAEFSGTIFSAQHDWSGRDPLTQPGNLRLQVRLPAAVPGQRDPLVVTGRGGAGDVLIIEYMDAGTVRFGWDHWGTPMIHSDPVALDFARRHTLDIAMASLRNVADATSRRHPGEGTLMVAVDGRRIWEHAGLFFPAEAAEVVVGRNPIGATTCGPVFSGEILSARRIARE